MADLMESNIEVEAEGGQEGGPEGERDTLELMAAPDKRYSEISEVPPSNVPVIPLRDVHSYKPGSKVYPFLPQVPVMVRVTASTGHAVTASSVAPDAPRDRPRLRITLEHGPFEWTVYKPYRDVLSLRRELLPLRDKLRRRRRDNLPPLLNIEDMNVRQGTRLRKQVPKVQTFLNAVLSNRTFRAHPATASFFEVSRISFITDAGEKKKEGLLIKRSGGHRRAVDCFGFTACFICRCSFWRRRWFVVKDSYLVAIRSHHSKEARRTISGVTLFDTGMTVNHGIAHTGIRHGIKISTQSRDLLVKAHSKRTMNDWVGAIESVMESTGKIWVEPKPYYSFAPERKNTASKWYVDGEHYMADVADAILAAKDEIFITDWQISPHIFLKRRGSYKNRLEWRLDNLLLKKAREGVRIFLLIYKELELAIQLGSEYALHTLEHPNIVFLRHPDVFISGVLLWAHHEKIIVIDQTLAFVGGIDLAFGRWDNECHKVSDDLQAPPQHISELASATVAGLVGGSQPVEETDDGEEVHQKWVGKDFFNPFIEDAKDLHEPFADQFDRSKQPRMPWHDIASAVYGPAARDVARHFIQRHNFTKRELESGDDAPYLLPRKTFSDSELQETQYLRDVLGTVDSEHATAQVLRSSAIWSAGIPIEHSIMNAWISAIDKAEHFIYIEQQFFISSLLKEDVSNGVAEALRLRIARAHRDGQTFRVIVVMPLLPSFPAGNFGESETAILEAVIHWNYHSISRGKDSLFGRLHHMDGIPEDELHKYISVYGLRTHGEIGGRPASEIVYVHSKLLIVDDRITIIGSANINDRSMTGDRDSEVAVRYEDTEMIEGTMNGEPCQVGKFSHSLRTFIFREHLGLLPTQQTTTSQPADPLSVEDPVCDQFYLHTWMETAHKNSELFEQIFGGAMLPTDATLNYGQLKEYRKNTGLVGADVDKAHEALLKVQGIVVEMPLHFLEKENLEPNVTHIINFAPDHLFT
jgi:phospholipase D1/2